MIRVIRIIYKYYKNFSTVINQMYFEWYEFDVNVVRILYLQITFVVSTNESE